MILPAYLPSGGGDAICVAIRDRDHRRIAALHAEAGRWFAAEILPLIVPSVPASIWRTGHVRSGSTILCDGWIHHGPLDHQTVYRFGRKAIEFVAVGMPYQRSAARMTLAAYGWSFTMRHLAGLKLTWLPDCWSWHYPGWTKICVVAPPGLVELPPALADKVAEDMLADVVDEVARRRRAARQTP